MSDIKSIIQKEKARINDYLSTIFSEYKRDLSDKNRISSETLERLETLSLKGGKGVRGALLIVSACMFGYVQDRATLMLASALELFHSSLLIHDDIMDNDLLRRGKPSIYSQYIPQGAAIGADDPTQYAKSLGMCVGDVGFFIGFDICSRISQEYPINSAILPTLCQEFALVGFAQMQDVHLAEGATIPDYHEIMEVYRLKTARYTFSLPLRLGGMLAGKDEGVLTQLDKLGEHIGIIFQIRDDEIGLFSTEAEIGKPIGSDLRENKKTLIRALLSTNLPDHDLKIVEKISHKEQITADDLMTIKQFMNDYGIKKQVDALLKEHTSKALKILEKLPISTEYKPTLTNLISFVATRTS